MKTALSTLPLVLFILLGTCYAKFESTKNNVLANKRISYEEIIEMVRKAIKEGYPDAGIPQLDPYKLDYAHVDFQDNIFRVLANVTDSTFTGLGDFQIRKFNFDVGERTYEIVFDVFFPSLKFTSDYYQMKGSIIDVFPLAGEGVAHVEIFDFNIWSKLYLKLTDDDSGMLVDRFEDAGFSMSRIVSKTEYDNNFDDILNAMIEELLPDYLNRSSRYLAYTYSPYLVDALNKALFEL
ncbi:hypothetical protein NE865_11948 [Phthorimaea operculella]|nr:hypothetical protein NE865_11948 [Phthorimaea operculella]